MVALLSATAEKTCLYWDLNMNSVSCIEFSESWKNKRYFAIKY
jgi:hypothetical protein